MSDRTVDYIITVVLLSLTTAVALLAIACLVLVTKL